MHRILAALFVALVCQTALAQHSITANSTGFVIQITTGQETVTYQWTPPPFGSLYTVGSVTVTDSLAPAAPLVLGSHIDWIGGSESLEQVSYQTTGTLSATLKYNGPNGATNLTVVPQVDGVFASLKLIADRPTIQDVYLGQVPSSYAAQAITVPYYSQQVNYIASANVFENSYFDPFQSDATSLGSQNGEETYYAPNQKGIVNPLLDLWKVSVSKNIDQVLPSPEHPRSPYRQTLAGRMVLDIRPQPYSFASLNSMFQNMADYGITHCVGILHNWQQFGYDNGFPAQYPANTTLGSQQDLMNLTSTAKAQGCLFALHENYADYYPDYPGYNAAQTMLFSSGAQAIAWYNPITQIQSFATKPSLFVPLAQTQAPLIHRSYGTDASYIDVNSSATPWWRVDMDASVPNSGMFRNYRDGSVALWQYQRTVEGGPVFGEGKFHWFWSGLLDGVEAQFGGEAPPITNGMTAPLFVDFDLLKIHPLEVNHGMGYYNRWMQGGVTTTAALDAYRMEEVIFGHAPYLTDVYWPSVPRALLEQNLVGPVATRYGMETPVAINYLVNGAWVGASEAAKAQNFSVVSVKYQDGLTVVANSLPNPYNNSGVQLPQYGWLAQGNGLLAYTGVINGQIADYAQTPNTIYANARNQADLLSENTIATPSVAAFVQLATNCLSIRLAWDVNTVPTVVYQDFIHFVADSSPANGQAGAISTTPRLTNWTVGQQEVDSPVVFWLPPTMPDGTYQVRVGLFNGLNRPVLYGNDDGYRRYTVGTLLVQNHGATLTFTPVPITIQNPDPRLNANQTLVDFPTIQTDGMVMMKAINGGMIEISAYPRSRDVSVVINANQIAMPPSLTCDDGTMIIPLNAGPGYWQVDLRGYKYCLWSGSLPAMGG